MTELVCKTFRQVKMRSQKGPASNGCSAAGGSMDGAEVGLKDGLGACWVGQTAEVSFLQVLSVRELRQRKRLPGL